MNEKKKLKNRILEYCKTILHKVSFSKTLFKKEYRKSFTFLHPDDHLELKKWLRLNLNLKGNKKPQERLKGSPTNHNSF